MSARGSVQCSFASEDGQSKQNRENCATVVETPREVQGETVVPAVEMVSLYAQREADPRHEQVVKTFRTAIAGFRENVEDLEKLLAHFEFLDIDDRPNCAEYRTELRGFMQQIELKRADFCSKTSELSAFLKQWEEVSPEDAFCSCCQQTKPPSPLSCPSHHHLCLDCSAAKYLSKDLKCICDTIWSRDQCESLHRALVANRPALESSLPQAPHRPLDEVQCQHCKRSVGLAALDSYICQADHKICKKCARQLSVGPACASGS